MSGLVAKSATGAADRSGARPRRRAAQPAPGKRSEESEAPPEADLRLIIEEQDGQPVYVVIDRSTGQEVNRFLREEMVRLADQGIYVAGDGVSTKA